MTRSPGRTGTVVSLVAIALLALGFTLFHVLRGTGDTRFESAGSKPGGGPPKAGAAPRGDGPPLPVGQTGGWELAFSDEFDGSSLDRDKWTDRSSAAGADGQGNKDNQQLELNQAANCEVADGELALVAKREAATSRTGERYDWTSCLLTTTPSYTFQYGYLEERAILPAERGFWPAFWTWQAPDVNKHVETDVYEFYSDNPTKLYLTQHSGAEARCKWTPKFDPAADWHTYAAAIEPSGTTWYVDGAQVCKTPATSDAKTNIITNLAVFAEIPPADGTDSAVKRVDYIRAWEKR